MATEHKEQVLVVGEMSNLKDLIELAKERGFKTPLAAMTRDFKRGEAEFAELLASASVDGAMRERLAADYWRLRRVLWFWPPTLTSGASR
jgi:hypothetical protein